MHDAIDSDAKRLASARAKLAIAGIRLEAAADGTFVATLGDQRRELKSLQSAAALAQAALDRLRW